MMVLLGYTFGVDESFIKGKELINTNSSQNILNKTLGHSAREFNSAQLNVESLGAHTMINEHISDRDRVKQKMNQGRAATVAHGQSTECVSKHTATHGWQVISSSCKPISCCKVNSPQHWEGSCSSSTTVCFKLLLKCDGCSELTLTGFISPTRKKEGWREVLVAASPTGREAALALSTLSSRQRSRLSSEAVNEPMVKASPRCSMTKASTAEDRHMNE